MAPSINTPIDTEDCSP
jgi:hypothetical protein